MVPFLGGGEIRVCLDGAWYNIRLKAPLYYDGQGRMYPYPTVYTEGENRASISYDEAHRRWLFRLESQAKDVTLEVEGRARSVPFWMGKFDGPYIVHGLYHSKEDLDIWGGFWEVGVSTVRLKAPNLETLTFQGPFLFDRAIHRVCLSETSARAGLPLAFTALYIFHPEFDLMLLHSDNPHPDAFSNFPFQHQGRLNFPSRDEDFVFDGFEYSDEGGLQPGLYRLTGSYAEGQVDLQGEAYEFWPQVWKAHRGTWWDPNGRYTWGRAFIRWHGTITLRGETIEVKNAWGVGEFTRFEPGQ